MPTGPFSVTNDGANMVVSSHIETPWLRLHVTLADQWHTEPALEDATLEVTGQVELDAALKRVRRLSRRLFDRQVCS